MNQKTALEILKMGKNVFLTGAAGSGKTYLLNEYIDYLRSQNVLPAVTASTGIAATHMNGTTIHSWSGIHLKDEITAEYVKKLSKKSLYQKRFAQARVLIIDEVSMLHAHQLDNIDKICRYFKEPFLPFGGLQIIFCGDFFQLPPIRKSGQGAHFAFDSSAWKEMGINVCYLDEQHRQKDAVMLRVLNDIRSRKVTDITKGIVNSRMHKNIVGHVKPTRIFSHNADADYVNNEELARINQKSYSYHMHAKGAPKLVEFLKKSCLAPEEMVLKQGAQVMFIKNNFEEGYVNGSVGVIVGFEEDSKLPIVELKNGNRVVAQPNIWEIEEQDKILATIRQLPLRLAWAITIHKSQGMSLDAAEVDLGRSFEYGMGYVALSRVRSLEGLKLLGINNLAFEVNPQVAELDCQFFDQSNSLEEETYSIPSRERKNIQKEFIRKVRKC